MHLTLAPRPVSSRLAKGVPVAASTVSRWLDRLDAFSEYRSTFPEIASAIAHAATLDPLFPGDRGPTETAALLVALAWSQSGFHRSLIREEGRRFGLFGVMVPREASADVFLLPHTAAFAVIEMLRQQLEGADRSRVEERLAWYGEDAPRTVARVALARALLAA